jgi:predicted ATPase
MLSALAVSNYRSLRSLLLPLRGLNVITGANGSGKSSVYRSLRLLADAAQGGLIPALAREGGLQSTLWAGPETISRAMRRGEVPVQGTRRSEPVNLKLGFAGEEYGYSIELGLPAPRITAFGSDPEIKRECIWHGAAFRPAGLLMDRRNGAVQIMGGKKEESRLVTTRLSPFDSMMSQLADPRSAPEVLLLREQIRSWRFYDHFRTDAQAPARLPQVGTYTPVLSNDGADLAAALQTIAETGDPEDLARAVDDAFPGARVEVQTAGGRFEVAMYQQGLLRPLSAAELSDGTLRYLLWIAALLTPRPPGLLVLNEPETSLHPDLLPALGRLIAQAARHTQVLVVSHARRLIAALEEARECNSLMLEKELGETQVVGADALDMPAWHWPPR